MAWAELVLEYIRALSWPLSVIGLAVVFRRQIGQLLDGISEVTAPGNISFKRRVSAARVEAEDANEATMATVGATSDASEESNRALARVKELDRYVSLAETDPAGAITGTWRVVRHVVRDVTRELGTDRELEAGAFTTAHLRTLVPLGLSEDMVDVARQLSGLRNDVVHGRRVRTDFETAESYLTAAGDLLDAVKAVERTQGRRP